MKPRCECCGREVEDALTVDEIVVAAAFSPLEASIFEFIAKARGRIVTSWQIVDSVYAGARDGGPNNPSQVMSAHARRMNAKLAAVGDRLKIQTNGNGFRFVYIETKYSHDGGFTVQNQREGALQ